jgi:hypothetical protein
MTFDKKYFDPLFADFHKKTPRPTKAKPVPTPTPSLADNAHFQAFCASYKAGTT